MPNLPLRPCTQSGCPALTSTGRCAAHPYAAWFPDKNKNKLYDAARGTSTQRGYTSQWRKRRAAVLRANPYCVQCGAMATDVDHIVKRSLGGSDERHNLRGLCRPCHNKKTRRGE
jgi:5-methylcytosine-specific restriction enzyme A